MAGFLGLALRKRQLFVFNGWKRKNSLLQRQRKNMMNRVLMGLVYNMLEKEGSP